MSAPSSSLKIELSEILTRWDERETAAMLMRWVLAEERRTGVEARSLTVWNIDWLLSELRLNESWQQMEPCGTSAAHSTKRRRRFGGWPGGRGARLDRRPENERPGAEKLPRLHLHERPGTCTWEGSMLVSSHQPAACEKQSQERARKGSRPGSPREPGVKGASFPWRDVR